MTTRIAATDEHPVSAVSLHVGQRHGLVVERQVRDRPAALKRDHDVKIIPYFYGPQAVLF
jgi:hypothetical protein